MANSDRTFKNFNVVIKTDGEDTVIVGKIPKSILEYVSLEEIEKLLKIEPGIVINAGSLEKHGHVFFALHKRKGIEKAREVLKSLEVLENLDNMISVKKANMHQE